MVGPTARIRGGDSSQRLRNRSLTARSERAQLHHFTCCLVAFCVLERERQDRRLTIYVLKRQLSCHGRTVELPALERLRQSA